MTAICLLLLVGAFAKSAQIPFHTWLPDAMEGPTPVSSLIHAATMVTAGVYLIARTHVLFVLAPTAADIAAFVGLATLLVAGTIAIAQTDLKRVIAYSTMSQIGYMIMGVSIGAYAQGLFHLMTHAFFKALLFMAAGSIISAMANMQNIDKMSGFWKAMRFTSLMLVDRRPRARRLPPHLGLLLQGLDPRLRRGARRHVHVDGDRRLRRRLPHRALHLPPDLPGAARQALQGGAGADRHRPPLPRAAREPATGEAEDTDVGFPGPEHHIAEQSKPMAIAMAVLGFGALFAGLIQIPGVTDVLFKWLDPAFANSPLSADPPERRRRVARPGGRRASSRWPGSGVSWVLWRARRRAAGAPARAASRPLYLLFLNKWYFDEAIDFLVVRPALAIGRFANGVFERFVIDGAITDRHRGRGARRQRHRPRRPERLRPQLRAAR